MLKQDIEIVNKILTGRIQRDGEIFLTTKNDTMHGPYASYSLIYPYTNDILSEYENEVKGKNVLTVAGSGDQALMAVKNGAEQLQMFDINRLSKYYSNLKIAAVKALTYEQYVEFFNPKEDLFFSSYDKRTFEKILMKLPSHEAMFWHSIYNIYFCLYNYKLINECYSFDKSPLRYKDDYNKIKNNLKGCNILPFIETDLFYLDEKLEKNKFDSMIFSNITSYIEDSEIISLKELLGRLNNNLEEDGIIQTAHIVTNQCLNNGKDLIRRYDMGILSKGKFKKIYKADEKREYAKESNNTLTCFYKKR